MIIERNFYEENCSENPFISQDKKDIFSVITGSWAEEVKFDDKLEYKRIKSSSNVSWKRKRIFTIRDIDKIEMG